MGKFKVIIRERETDVVVEEIPVRGNMRSAEQVKRGVNINLNHGLYYATTVKEETADHVTTYLTSLAESVEDRQGEKRRMTVILSERHSRILDKLVKHFNGKPTVLAARILEKALEDSERVLIL